MSQAVRRLFERALGGTQRRVILAILTTALLPLAGGLLVARTVIDRVSETAFQPEFGEHLERSLGVYADLVKAIKQSMRAEADLVAASPALAAATKSDPLDAAAIEQALATELASHPSLVSLVVEREDGTAVVQRNRPAPVDPARERTLTVRKELPTGDGSPLLLAATFATDNARFAEMESAQAFLQAYRQIERHHRAEYLADTYVAVFAVLLGVTVVVGGLAGVLVARPVTRRIRRLAAATRPVAAGDLSVRVEEDGYDEIAHLGRAFNRMLSELDSSRARIEFLRRMSEWQKVARRLAHEIKNPLTPIQLAVEECHRRYSGDDPEYKRIVQTTLEVVEEEIGTLRRLVGEFSSFARLPRAELEPGDLAEFLRDQIVHHDSGEIPHDDLPPVRVDFDVPKGPAPVLLDREMMHRVLGNLVQNSKHALRDAKRPGRVLVTLRREGDWELITVDDDGPGIPADLRASVFDPYFTTKSDGTGLGLAIVKKIVVDHGGTIEATSSPLGGARIAIRLPRAGTAVSKAAVERQAASGSD